MDVKKKKQKFSTSEIASPSLSKMEPKKKNMKKKKKKQKMSKSLTTTSSSPSNKDLVITSTSPSLISNVDVEKAMKKQNDIAMFLAGKVISSVGRECNFVFSPASINAVLTMVVASSDKETLRSFILSFFKSSSIDELIVVFNKIATDVLVDGSSSGGPNIAAVNGVWMDQTLSVSPFLKDLFEKFFKAAFFQVDFRLEGEKIRKKVNSWASKQTNGVINNLLPPNLFTNDVERNCLYGNALYFKGAWQQKFPNYLTRGKEFHLLNGTSVSVPFMSSHSDTKHYVKAYDGFKVLKLPFRQCGDTSREFSMYFYLPDEKDGLDDLVKRMASTPGFLDSHIPDNKVKVGEFRIPKFKVKFGFEASSVFEELEMVSLYHKARVEIDEDGAEAAAVFAIWTRTFGCCRKIVFVADHPFLFLIREDKTGTILFLIGQVLDPSKSSSG